MTAQLKISSVKEVAGFTPPFDNANRYNGSSLISRRNEYKALFITGEINGSPVSFYSPTVHITHTSGFLNHSICHNKNGWFDVMDGEQTAHYGAKMFNGGDTPNVALDSHSKVICLIHSGDSLNIRYSIKAEKNGVKILNRVAIIKKLD